MWSTNLYPQPRLLLYFKLVDSPPGNWLYKPNQDVPRIRIHFPLH